MGDNFASPPSALFCWWQHGTWIHPKTWNLRQSLLAPTNKSFGSWKVVRHLDCHFQCIKNERADDLPIKSTMYIAYPNFIFLNKTLRKVNENRLLGIHFYKDLFWKIRLDQVRPTCTRNLETRKQLFSF